MRKTILATTLVVFLLSSFTLAQDYTGQERIKISNTGVGVDWPYAAVNATGEIGTFYMWFGGSGSADGITFRKLDKVGKPIGPQKIIYKTNPSETRGFEIWDVVWANGNYFVLVENRVQDSILLFKFSENGSFVSKTRYKLGEREYSYTPLLHCLIFGDDIYIPMSTGEGYFFGPTSDVGDQGDRKTENYFLKTSINNPKNFEKIEFLAPTDKYMIAAGASVDADHIVVLLSETWIAADLEQINPSIVSYNPITGKAGPLTKLPCHDEVSSFFFFGAEIPKPVYNGQGHIFFYEYYGIDYGYYSYVYDSQGNTVYGPVNIGQLATWQDSYDSDLVGSFAFMGNYNPDYSSVCAMVLGPKGKHAKNIFYEEDRKNNFYINSLGQVFTGNNVVFIYEGIKARGIFSGDTRDIYSKAIPTPKPVREGIAFFQAGSQNFEDGSRHLIWSIVGAESVTIKHDGQEYYPLPPQYSFKLPKANSKKPVELTFTSATGKTYSKKIRLK